MKRIAPQPQQNRTILCATDRQGSLLAQLQAGQLDRIAYTAFGHRSPAAGIGFNSPDSLSPFGKGGINAYAYCVGDPINRHDCQPPI